MNEKALMLAVFAQMEREKTVSIPQLARLLDETEDAVSAALEKLVFAYDNVSIYMDLQESYARLADHGTTRILRLTAEETGILIDALEAQGIPKDSELSQKLVQTKGFFDSADAGKVRTVAHNAEGSLAQTVAMSCEDEEHHLLQISYQKEGAANAEERVVEPYLLTAEQGNTALEAYCHNADGWRTFRMSRIQNARVLTETFQPRELPDSFLHDRLANAPRARVLLRAGMFLPAWPDVRKDRTREDGSMEVSVPWLGGAWLVKRIAALGGGVQVLEPAELADAVSDYAHQLLDAL